MTDKGIDLLLERIEENIERLQVSVSHLRERLHNPYDGKSGYETERQAVIDELKSILTPKYE